MKIIGFTGKMGCGKSTAISILKKLSEGKSSTLVKFAQPLYDMQEYIYSRIEDVYTRPETFVKDRKLLQWLGTEWGRQIISDKLWIDLWKAEVTQYSNYDFIYCDDVRFENEAQALKDLGGILIRVTSEHNTDRITTANGIVNHASEGGIDPKYVDYGIENSGTLEDFNKTVCTVSKMIESGIRQKPSRS